MFVQDPPGFVHQHLAPSVGNDTKSYVGSLSIFHHCETLTNSTVDLHKIRKKPKSQSVSLSTTSNGAKPKPSRFSSSSLQTQTQTHGHGSTDPSPHPSSSRPSSRSWPIFSWATASSSQSNLQTFNVSGNNLTGAIPVTSSFWNRREGVSGERAKKLPNGYNWRYRFSEDEIDRERAEDIERESVRGERGVLLKIVAFSSPFAEFSLKKIWPPGFDLGREDLTLQSL